MAIVDNTFKKEELVNILSEYYANSHDGMASKITRELAAQLNSQKVQPIINCSKSKQSNSIFCQIMIDEVLKHSYSKPHDAKMAEEAANSNAEKLISMLAYTQQQQLEFLLFKYYQALSGVSARRTQDEVRVVWYNHIINFLKEEGLEVRDQDKEPLWKKFSDANFKFAEIAAKNMAEKFINSVAPVTDVRAARMETARKVKDLQAELQALIQALSKNESFWEKITRHSNEGKKIPIGIQSFAKETSLVSIINQAKYKYSRFFQSLHSYIRGRDPLTNELYRLLSKVDLNEEKSLRKTIEDIKTLIARNEPEVTKTTLKK